MVGFKSGGKLLRVKNLGLVKIKQNILRMILKKGNTERIGKSQ